jgi:hypothetical protein
VVGGEEKKINLQKFFFFFLILFCFEMFFHKIFDLTN